MELENNPDKNNIKLKFAPVAGDSVRIDKKSPIDMSLGATSFAQSNNGGYVWNHHHHHRLHIKDVNSFLFLVVVCICIVDLALFRLSAMGL